MGFGSGFSFIWSNKMKQLKVALEKAGLKQQGMKQGEKRYKVLHLPSAQFISYLGYPSSRLKKNKKLPVLAIFKNKASAGHARDFITGWNKKLKYQCFGFVSPIPDTQKHIIMFEIVEVDEYENTQTPNL
jgi:hypothetical protein